MYIQAIGADAFSVYIPGPELEAHHITPSELTCEEVLRLLTASLGSAVKNAVVELYPGKNELLIFVLNSPAAPEFYAFPSVEELIPAAESCRCDASILFHTGSEYILCTLGGGNLGEFGERIKAPAAYLSHLFEHSRCLISGSALTVLRSAFLKDA